MNRGTRPTPMPEWMRELKAGDVIKHRDTGRMRVVRQVSIATECRIFVFVLIAHCSWTGRCYTLLDRHQLASYVKMPVHRRRLRSRFDLKVRTAVYGNEHPGSYTLTCCDVEGIP